METCQRSEQGAREPVDVLEDRVLVLGLLRRQHHRLLLALPEQALDPRSDGDEHDGGGAEGHRDGGGLGGAADLRRRREAWRWGAGR